MTDRPDRPYRNMKEPGRQTRAWPMGLVICATFLGLLSTAANGESPNLFANPSFELGRGGWQMDKAGKTECRFSVDEKEAADGQTSTLITVGSIENWGVQFGQHSAAGQKGKTYTLAAFAKSTKGPVEIGLQIERSASPWDRAASEKFNLTTQWQEFHLTFKVEKEFPQGWFSYLSCTQPDVQFRADMFRLYEGPYVPYAELARQATATAAVRLFDSGKPSPVALSGEALSLRTGWTEIPEDQLVHSFVGDTVIVNDKVGLVLRRGAAGAELYSLVPNGAVRRALLAPVAGTNTAAVAVLHYFGEQPRIGGSGGGVHEADGPSTYTALRTKTGSACRSDREPRGRDRSAPGGAVPLPGHA